MSIERAAIQLARLPSQAAPSGANLLYSLDIGRAALAFQADSAVEGQTQDVPVQPAMHATRQRWLLGVAGSAALTAWGLNTTASGTLTARTPAATNAVTAASRVGLVASTLAGAVCGWRHGANHFFRAFQGLQNGGGFFLATRIGIPSSYADTRFFFGMCATAGALPSNEPGTLLNACGFVAGTTDPNLRLLVSNASTPTVLTPSGWSANAKVAASVIYDLAVYSGRESSVIGFGLRALGGAWQTARVNASTLGPPSSTLLSPQLWLNSPTAQTTAVALDLHHVVLETDY